MTKQPSPEKAAKELAKREKQLAKPKGRYYLAYLTFIISIIYITDEVASQIGTFMKTEIANDMLAKFGESSVGMLDIITFLSFPFMALGVLYKPLADRFGRKPFLIINTFGMCLGLIVIYLTESVPMYIVGACITQFFVTHDMQAVYILETAPDKHRAKAYSIIKSIAMLGVLLIPLLRRMFMQETAQWRRVYLIPALLGFVVSGAALLLAQETDAFNIARINYLKGNVEDNGTEASGGIITALKFIWQHKQLRWIFIALVFAETGYILTADYQVIMTYNYAGFFTQAGRFADLDTALESVGVNEITTALFLFPVGCALGQLLPGFISDKLGRKKAAVSMSICAVIFFLGFSMGAKHGMNPSITGFLCGACIGTFWSNIDTLVMMAGESTPTALRSSVLSATNMATGLGIGVSFGISIPLMSHFGNASVGTIALCLAVPGLIADFLILTAKVHETTGVDLKKIKGNEWE